VADSTVTDLDELLQASRHIRRRFEPQWLVNVSYTLGKQWIKVDAAGLLYDVNIGDDRVTLTDNRIRGAVHTSIAKQTKTPPAWVGVPKDPSDEEIQRARLRSIVFEHYWRELQARRKLHSALWYRETCGAGFWKITWDKSAGEKMTVLARPDGGPVLLDQFQRPMRPEMAQGLPPEVIGQVEERQIATGDVCLDLRTPWAMYPDALATEEGLESCEHIGEEEIHSRESLMRRYPDADWDKIQETSAPSAGIMESRFPGASALLRDGKRGAPHRRGIKVREFWSKDKHCVWTADGVYLLEEANEYPFLPYVMFSGFSAGRFWPDAPVSDMISPQTELNKVSSQIAENSERFGNPALLESSEMGAGAGEWSGLPGERIVYNVVTGGQADVPGFMSPPEMPMYVQNRLPQIVESLNAISGQQEVAQGTVPEGVTAASAISMLLEANDTRLGPQIAEMGDSLVDAGRRLLWYLRAFAKTERMARIAGDESMWDIYAFQGEQLGDASADEVEVGSSISNSTAMQQTVIRDMLNLLIQNGQVPPPRELRKLMRSLNVGGIDNFFATLGRVQRFVIEENRRILREAQELLLAGGLHRNELDDDQVHLEEHTDFFMSATYQEASRKPGGEQVRQVFEMHVQEHRDELQRQANAQAMAQANMQALAAGQPGTGPDLAAAASNGNGSVPPA
jgi:hypothetical protein